MHNYEKRYVDAEGNYEIWQLRTDGSQRRVDADYAGYVLWAQTNTVPEIAYIAPPEPGVQPPTLETRVSDLEILVLQLGGVI